MKRRMMAVTGLVMLLGLLFNGAVFAQEAVGAGQDTMRVVDENQQPEDIVNLIALPENVSPEGIANGQPGEPVTINQALERNRERTREGTRERVHQAQQDGAMLQERLSEHVSNRDQIMEQARDRMMDQVRDRLGDQAADSIGQQGGQAGGHGNRR